MSSKHRYPPPPPNLGSPPGVCLRGHTRCGPQSLSPSRAVPSPFAGEGKGVRGVWGYQVTALAFGGLAQWDPSAGRGDVSRQPNGAKKIHPNSLKRRRTPPKNPSKPPKSPLPPGGLGGGRAGQRDTPKDAMENEVTAGSCHPHSMAGAGGDGSSQDPATVGPQGGLQGPSWEEGDTTGWHHQPWWPQDNAGVPGWVHPLPAAPSPGTPHRVQGVR